MMLSNNNDKPPVNVVFTPEEQLDIQKTTIKIQQEFVQLHQEIISPSNSDLASMIRQEKHIYANLGIMFAVQSISAMEKIKKL